MPTIRTLDTAIRFIAEEFHQHILLRSHQMLVLTFVPKYIAKEYWSAGRRVVDRTAPYSCRE